jgi:DNA-binding XRE family transcriptional regulator
LHSNVTKIGAILRKAREAKGLTQAALSNKLGISTRTIISIEKDKRHPTYEVFFKIIRALELSADHIFWPENMPFTPEQEQLIRAVSSCSERDKTVFMEIAWAFVHAAGENKDEK